MNSRLVPRASGSATRISADARVIRRVRWRLVAWSGGATFVVLALLGLAIYGAVAGSLAGSGRQQLEARASTIERFLQAGWGGVGQTPPIGFAFGGATSGTFAYIVTPTGHVLGPREFTASSLPDKAGIEAAGAGTADVRQVSLSGIPFRVLSLPVETQGGRYVVQVAQETTAERRALEALLSVLVVGGLLGVLGSIAVGALYAGRALVPIRESLRRQREFTADASHELRTPLAVIRSAVEYLERHPDERLADVTEVISDVRDEVDHLSALVGDLLLLARTDSGTIDVELLPLDLADTAAEALSSLSNLAAARGVRLTLDPAAAPVLGDPLRLRQLVTILADNAISHTPAGRAATVRVRSAGRTALLVVEDEGPGIRPEDLPRVFDRFWRAADAPGGGTGLGLAIAAWIVERHAGTIEAANREGGGALFTVRLPLDRARLPSGSAAGATGARVAPDPGGESSAGAPAGGAQGGAEVGVDRGAAADSVGGLATGPEV